MRGTTDINQFKGSESTDIKSDQKPNQTEPKPNQTDTKSDQKSNQKGNQKSDRKIIEILKENTNTTIHQLMDLMQMSESGIKKILKK